MASGETAPLLEVPEAALDDVAAAVVGGIEVGRPTAASAAAQPVADLIGWLRDERDDPASP